MLACEAQGHLGPFFFPHVESDNIFLLRNLRTLEQRYRYQQVGWAHQQLNNTSSRSSSPCFLNTCVPKVTFKTTTGKWNNIWKLPSWVQHPPWSYYTCKNWTHTHTHICVCHIWMFLPCEPVTWTCMLFWEVDDSDVGAFVGTCVVGAWSRSLRRDSKKTSRLEGAPSSLTLLKLGHSQLQCVTRADPFYRVLPWNFCGVWNVLFCLQFFMQGQCTALMKLGPARLASPAVCKMTGIL